MATSGRVIVYSQLLFILLTVCNAIDDDQPFGYCGGGYSDTSQIPNFSSGMSTFKTGAPVAEAAGPPAPRPFKSGVLPLDKKGNRSFTIKFWPTKKFHDEISNNITTRVQYKAVMDNVVIFFQSFIGVDKHNRTGSHDASPCIRFQKNSFLQETGNKSVMHIESHDYHLVLDTGTGASCGKPDSNVLAFASSCAGLTHSNINRRQLLGLTYVCPGRMSGKPMENIAFEATMKHEIFHALGVTTSNLLHHNFSESVSVNWESAHGTTKRERSYYIRKEVRDAARLHFNCPSLKGAEIEGSGSSGTAGGHWDMRVFGPELMVGVISRRSYLSNITVTFMQQLGSETGNPFYPWINTSMVEDLWFGKGATCLFTEGSCKAYIDANTQWQKKPRTPSFPYCSLSNVKAYIEAKKTSSHGALDLGTCSPDHATVLKCYLNDNPPDSDSEKYSLYYPGLNIRGKSEVAEYCPTFIDIASGFKDTNCFNDYSQPEGSKNHGAEQFGKHNSGCFEQETPFYMTNCKESTWKRMLYGAGKSIAGFSGAGCYKYECQNGRLLVSAAGDDTRYGAKVCWAEGATVLIRRMIDEHTFVYGEILCPKCQAFCPYCLPDILGVKSRDQLEPACQDGGLSIREPGRYSMAMALSMVTLLLLRNE